MPYLGGFKMYSQGLEVASSGELDLRARSLRYYVAAANVSRKLLTVIVLTDTEIKEAGRMTNITIARINCMR